MNLMYCCTIIIFMIIVDSNSFQNYRIIDPKFINCNTDDDYLCYWNPQEEHPNYFNQKCLDPEDFYLTLYNPYFYFFYHSDIFNDKVISYSDFIQKRDKYLKEKYNLIASYNYSIVACDQDLKYTGSYPKYWPKRPKFYVLNRKIAKYYNIYKLMHLYYSNKENVVYNGDEIKRQIGGYERVSNVPTVAIKDITLWDKVQKNPVVDLVYQKFYQINEKEYEVLLSLMAFLPKVDEKIVYYLKRHVITVYSLLYLNVRFTRLINSPKELTIMSKNRVENLKSPYLILRESYNCYVMRMKNMNKMPFNIEFFQKKYNLFKDDYKKTIFDELGVHFREVQHQEEHVEEPSSG